MSVIRHVHLYVSRDRLTPFLSWFFALSLSCFAFKEEKKKKWPLVVLIMRHKTSAKNSALFHARGWVKKTIYI